MTVYLWSTTAANNDDIDSSINFQEGQSPASLNNSCRAVMAAIAKWRDDLSGNLVTAGTSTAYTLTTNQAFSSLTDGLMVAARVNVTSGPNPTLNVDSRGAKSIAGVYGTAVGTGRLRAGGVYVFVYDSTDDKWIVQANPQEGFETGTKMLFQQTAAPTGWTKDTTHDNKALRVVSGTASSGGSTGFTTVFAARTISTANLPAHTHTFSATTSSDGAHTHTFKYNTFTGDSGSNVRVTGITTSGSGSTVTTTSDGAHTHTVSGTTSSVGSGTALDFDVAYVDLIIATKD